MAGEPSPGASGLNPFEVAILQRIARERPSLGLDVGGLRVRGRHYSGVGCYTDFLCDETGDAGTVPLEAAISVPGVPSGMGAALICRGRRPLSLETFTRGDDFWAGEFEGFAVG